ncbi:hypothetical protein EVAR_29415_1 [Eumeta japonica]|uniref:Uncharacterized protein n=1 Tax=Eumeta variegata TaxID=151549 RepID=A0A4C1VU74_EUMVA|nr:hypothetical protein EVAR_29415_1 [Eumeta japonica]
MLSDERVHKHRLLKASPIAAPAGRYRTFQVCISRLPADTAPGEHRQNVGFRFALNITAAPAPRSQTYERPETAPVRRTPRLGPGTYRTRIPVRARWAGAAITGAVTGTPFNFH